MATEDRLPGAPASASDGARPQIRRCEGSEELAQRVTAILIGTLAKVQGVGRVPSVVLTGGSIARKIHAAVTASPDRDLVDWSRVDFWWGDERYVAAADPERNDLPAHEDMLDHVPVDVRRVHRAPTADGEFGADVERAAAAYADELAGHIPDEGPWFDVLMLGVGPDGHCASLFPGRPEVLSREPVLAVRDSPKPPPTRISMGMETLNRAREVWFVVSGAEKAEAVAAGVNGTDVLSAPACGPKGQERTVWFVDADAAWML